MAWEAARYFLARGSRGRFHVEGPYFIFVFLCLLAAVLARTSAVDRRPAGSTGPDRSAWLLGGCLALAFVLYWPALSLGFLSDDFDLLAIARKGEALVVRPIFWRPLPIWLYAAADSIGGPVPAHLLNVALHGVNGWLVARLARVLGLGHGGAVAAALLFLTFPASVEPVAWISGLPDLLMTTLLLSAIGAWGAPWPLRLRLPLVLLAMLVALITKETSIVLPLLGLVVWWNRRAVRDNVVIAASLAAVVAAFAGWWLTQSALPADYARAPSRGLLKEILVRPFGGLGAPYHADLGTYGLALSLTAAVFFPLVLVLSAMAWRRDRDSFSRSLRMALWILVAVLPVYRYLYVARDLQGSRYLYLPAAGWSILLVGMVETARMRAGIGPVARTAALVLVLSAHAVALRLHFVPWREAAALRDATLHAAVEAMAARGCGPESTFTVTDSWRGAFVFRNGFTEALRRSAPPASGTVPCRLRWEAGSFVDE